MKRTGKDTPDLLSALESGSGVVNNARVVRDAQRADHDLEPSADTDWRGTIRPRLAFAGALLVLWALGITARLVYLQVYQYDDADCDGRASADRHDRSQPAARPDPGPVRPRARLQR